MIYFNSSSAVLGLIDVTDSPHELIWGYNEAENCSTAYHTFLDESSNRTFERKVYIIIRILYNSKEMITEQCN